MKINSQELMLLNNRQNLRRLNNQPTAPSGDAPVSNPESSLKALDAMAANNISFQGLNVAAIKKGARNLGLAVFSAGMLLTVPSCSPEWWGEPTVIVEGDTINLSNDVTVEMDTDAIVALLQELIDLQKMDNANADAILEAIESGKMSLEEFFTLVLGQLGNIDSSLKNITSTVSDWTALLQQIANNGDITNEKLQEISGKISDLYKAFLEGEINEQEFRAKMLEFMTSNLENQDVIITLLKENGMSQKEANAFLEKLLQEVKDGKLSAAEAYIKLMEVLGGIQNTLDNILAKLGEISDQITKNHEEYMNAKNQELDMLGKLYYQGKIDQSYFEDFYQNQNTMKNYLSNISANTDSLLTMLNDPAKYDQFMADLKNLMPADVDYEKFQKMFDMLGLTIEDVVNMSTKDLIGEINNFKNTYIKTEAEHAKKLDEIIAKLSYIATFLPKLDQSDVENAIKDLTNAVDKNTEVVGNGLDNINAKLDAVLEKLDKIFNNTSGLAKYFDEQNENWTNALGNLEKGNQMLDKILKEQQVTNSTLNGFKAEFKNVRDAQNLSNSYLYILTQKANDVENAIKDLDVNVAGGMTRDEFVDAMAQRDEKMAAEFKKFIEEYNFDNIPGDVQTIKDFLYDIKTKVEAQKDYSGQLDRIIALEGDILSFLQNANFSDPNTSAKLDEIINLLKNFKCNCECGKDSGSTNEGVEDLEDIFGNN